MTVDPLDWDTDDDFQWALIILKNLPMVNDVAERGLIWIEVYNNQRTKDESRIQYLLQDVSEISWP